jgi:uncharacterized membrane protein
MKLAHFVVHALVVGLNQHHHLRHLRKEGFEQGLVQNVVEDTFTQVHREEVKYEFAAVLIWLAKLASMLQHTTYLFFQWLLYFPRKRGLECSITLTVPQLYYIFITFINIRFTIAFYIILTFNNHILKYISNR